MNGRSYYKKCSRKEERVKVIQGVRNRKLRSEGRVTEVTTSMWKIERSEEGNVAIAQQGRELLEVRSER